MKKRDILILLPSLAGGGAERTLINLLNQLDYSKYNIDLILVVNDGVYFNHLPPEVNLVCLFESKTLVRILAFLQKKINFNYFFRKRIEKNIMKSYDIGISYLDGNFTDLLFFAENITKRYTWVHSSYKTNRNFAKFYENNTYVNKIITQRYEKLDGIYFVSNDAKKEFIEVFGEYPNMEVVYNLIDSNSVIEKSKLKNVSDIEMFHFMAIGSFLPVKGFDRLIRAAKIVNEKGYSFQLSIMGKGPEKSNLKTLVDNNNLSSIIKFVDFVSNPYPLLKSADVFVMSSISEALPTVLCEAMILEKATLVTNCSGCRELVEEGKYGLMAEANDEDLAAKMINYLSDTKIVKYYENQSKERAKIFNDKLILEKYNKILNQ